MTFVHLQISTAFSLLSSTISIPKLVEQAKKLNYTALSITDRNTLYGVLPFYQACTKAKIKPIIGMSADVESDNEGLCHPIILLAKNNEGYKNLLKISSAIKTHPKEMISLKWLRAYSSGLIAMTPGLRGEIEQFFLQDKKEDAIQTALKYKEIFGESFYLSLQNQGIVTNVNVIAQMREISEELNIPLAATNDVRYLEKADAFAYECLTAIRDGEKLADKDQIESVPPEFYLKSQEEMSVLFTDIPEALSNTVEIVERCNVMVETHQQLLPKYPLPSGELSVDTLKRLCLTEIEKRCPTDDKRYLERLHFELDVINKMGFNDYFLIVWDFMKYAREQEILTGPGRGSAAGSLVAYVLGITDVDPIAYHLLFERFLNPERISMPDIDIDFPDHRRDEVIEYVVKKYGKDKVAQIITFGTLAAKAAMRDTARVFGFNTKEMEQISKLIPTKLGITLAQAYKESPGLREFIATSDHNKKLYETALKLEGLPRHTSTHAAGVVMSEQPLVSLIPLQGGHAGSYLTQFPMEDLEEIGLLKMDFLGLRNLTLLERIVKSIQISTGKKLNIKGIPLADEKTFELLRSGETTGVFQLESEGMRKVLQELKPTEFEDIVAVNALYRPGPMENIPDYIARKHGVKPVLFPHPDLRSILEVTYGVIVYQEQIMQIAAKMAGYSLGEADLLRKAVSKKSKEVLDREREHFVTGALKTGYEESKANETYDLIVRFANYGFNRSHSVAYSMIAWQLAYLKANYPEHFMAALLTSVIGNEDKIATYMAEAKQMGLLILPPSINSSHYPFKVEKDGIRYSLAAIKGIGATALKEIIQVRKTKSFQDLFGFCLRVSQKVINRKNLEALVHSGCFDEFGKDRAVLLATLDVALEHAELMKPSETGTDLFAEEEMFQLKPRYVEVEAIGLADKLFYEKQATGVYISAHPVSAYEDYFHNHGCQSLHVLKPNQRNVSAGVYITYVKTIRTKKGDVMAFIRMSDASDEIEGVVFPDVYRRHSSICKIGETLLITGNIETREEKRQFLIQKMQKPEKKISSLTLFLKIPKELHQPDKLNKLHDLLKVHSGTTAVVLHYEATKQTIRLSSDWVNPSEICIDDLRKLLGADCVILK
ncbi:DNA polymerase III subunit alpha [Bacillus sp. FSL K6-3431]|uniref:DNA polymerase III subunit alpha n=1 Tax=Bacillus sp. FSL K6-3431 TaxID=2921500 RepID=UPI0030FA4A3B